MITTSQELLPKRPKMKPVWTKSLESSKARCLLLSNKRKERLRSLSINQQTWRSIQVGPKILKCLGKVLKTSKLLRKFKFTAELSGGGDYFGRRYTDMPLAKIVEGFKNHSALVDVDFFFGEAKKIENTMRFVTIGAGHLLAKLRRFAYKSWYCTNRRERFSSPSKKGLKRLRLLEKMALRTPRFNEPDIPAFNEWENRLFVSKNLKGLSLDLGGDSDEILARITNQLQGFHCLRSLSINFNAWKQLKIESVMRIIGIISQMALLESLYLGFPDCSKFTDDWMKVLCEALAKISTIKRLELNFARCQRIKTEGLALLNKCLGELGQQLTCVEFNFSRCSNMNAKQLVLLGETLKAMGLLRKVHINLQCCGISLENVELFVKDFEETSISLKVSYQEARKSMKIERDNRKSTL